VYPSAPQQVPPGPFNHPFYGGPPLLQHQAAALAAAASLQENLNNNNLGVVSESKTHNKSRGSQGTNGNTATGGISPSGAPAAAGQGAAGTGSGQLNPHSNSNNNAIQNAPSGRVTPSIGGGPVEDLSSGAVAAAARTMSVPGNASTVAAAPQSLPAAAHPSPRTLLPAFPGSVEGLAAAMGGIAAGSNGCGAPLPGSTLQGGITNTSGTPATSGTGLPLGTSPGPVNQGQAFLNHLLHAYHSMHQAATSGAGDTSGRGLTLHC
jgi:hypothetical protein